MTLFFIYFIHQQSNYYFFYLSNLNSKQFNLQVMNEMYNRGKYNLVKKLTDWSSDDIKAAIVKNSYVPNVDHNVWGDVSAHEVSGTNYTAGGISLLNKTVVQNDTLNKVVFDCDDLTWNNLTITDGQYVVLYDNTLGTKDLIACYSLSALQTISDTNFTVLINGSGLITI